MAGNAILRQPTLSILQQIDELKTWHKQQQSKISTGNSLTDKIEDKLGKVELLKEKDKTSGQAEVKQSSTPHNFDEIPIKVASSNFNSVIENNIGPTDAQHNDTSHNGVKPKRPFLRKGEGIARFRMGPQKIPKYGKNNNRTLKLSNGIKKPNDPPNLRDKNFKINSATLDKENKEKSNNVQTLAPLDPRLDFRNWESGKVEEILEKAIENNQLELFQPNSSIDSSTASVLEKLLLVGKKYVKEKEEQRIFEIMEQHDSDSSACSTPSYVENLMKNPISAPVKTSLMNHNSVSSSTHSNLVSSVPTPEMQQEVLVPLTQNKTSNEPIWINPGNINYLDQKLQDTVTNVNDLEQSLHVRFAEEIDYKSFVEYSSSINNSNQKEGNIFKEFDDSEEWKEDSENSECCSNSSYSSSIEDVRPISPLPKSSHESKNYQISNINTQSNPQNCRNSPGAKLEEVKINSNRTALSECPETATVEKDNLPPLVLEKVKELEEEIQIFRARNSKITALLESLEKERSQFEKEKKKLFKEIEKNKQENCAQLEEERKKLQKDKLVFEKYSKSVKKNPTKEERKEIQALRDQLSEIKEEMNKKGSRWSSAQARVRNQVKLLEEDNKKLREEIKILQSKYFELLTQKKKGKPFNNTKHIHAINNHISNIAVEDDEHSKKTSTQTGYFNTNPNKAKFVLIDEVDPNSIDTVKIIREGNPKSSLVVTHDESNHKTSELSLEQNASSHHLEKLNRTSGPEPHAQDEYCRNKGDKLEQGKYHESPHSEKSQAGANQEKLYNSAMETLDEEGNLEIVHPDGKKEIKYKNGTIKKIDPFTENEKLIYFNGDIKEVTRDGTVRYYFSETRVWQTTLPDGLEIFDFPNQQIEKRHKNGIVEIVYPNGCKKITHPDGSEEIYYTNGNLLKIEADKKKKVLYLPNGQKEIQTDECIRREYPDGTVRIVHPDGTIETIYSNGRVRLKDKHGNLVMDSG